MTNEEAIRSIDDMRRNAIGLMLEKKQIDALDMAIEALKAQNLVNEKPDLVKDLVNRQDAIDALGNSTEFIKRVLDENIVRSEREKYSWGLGLIEACIADLKELPSAEPEPEPVGCSGCRYEHFGSRVCDVCSRFYVDRYEAERRTDE